MQFRTSHEYENVDIRTSVCSHSIVCLASIIRLWHCLANAFQSECLRNEIIRVGFPSDNASGKSNKSSNVVSVSSWVFLKTHLENLPNLMATAVTEQNNRLWERLESHVQTQMNSLRQPLPTISVTGPQRQNTVWSQILKIHVFHGRIDWTILLHWSSFFFFMSRWCLFED